MSTGPDDKGHDRTPGVSGGLPNSITVSDDDGFWPMYNQQVHAHYTWVEFSQGDSDDWWWSDQARQRRTYFVTLETTVATTASVQSAPQRLPFSTIGHALEVLFTRKFVARVLRQTIMDVQVEYQEEMAAGHAQRARWVALCGYLSVGRALVSAVVLPVVELVRAIVELIRLFM